MYLCMGDNWLVCAKILKFQTAPIAPAFKLEIRMQLMASHYIAKSHIFFEILYR